MYSFLILSFHVILPIPLTYKSPQNCISAFHFSPFSNNNVYIQTYLETTIFCCAPMNVFFTNDIVTCVLPNMEEVEISL